MSLILISESNIWSETTEIYWISSQEDTKTWVHEEVPAGDIPFSVTSHDLVFAMETFHDIENIGTDSIAAIDEVSLYICLPCDFSILSNGKIELEL